MVLQCMVLAGIRDQACLYRRLRFGGEVLVVARHVKLDIAWRACDKQSSYMYGCDVGQSRATQHNII